jgi:uncharacterized protein YpuA (DUF1002 family)
MKKNILILAMVLGCFSCGSKTEKSMEKQKDLVREYINNINDVKSEEEFNQLRKEFKERIEFEERKLTKEEKDEYNRNMSWEEHQELKSLKKELRETDKEVRSRFK